MTIFKAYDIRGIYPAQINEEKAYNAALAYIKLLEQEKGLRKEDVFLLARDGRNSSPALHKAVLNAVKISGYEVHDLGLCPIDLFYFAAGNRSYKAGVIVTASHNPPEYNGLKCLAADVELISGQQIESYYKELHVDTNEVWIDAGKNTELFNDIKSEFIEFTLKKGKASDLNKTTKAVLDFGNGAAGVLQEIVEKLPLDAEILNKEIDGNFPGRGPNPSQDHGLLSKKVVEAKASLGAAWDSDSDRIVFVDESGKLVPGDLITALLSSFLIKQKIAEKIIYDLISSKSVPKAIARAGGIPISSKVGRGNIKSSLEKNNAQMGGELSGHYYYRLENWSAENTWLTLIFILHVLEESGQNFSDLIKQATQYYKSPIINIEQDWLRAAEAVRQKYSDGQISAEDGLTVEYSDWWFNIRPSNTEPVTRLVIEADSADKLEQKIQELKKIFENQ